TLAAHHALALCQGKFDHTRVDFVASAPREGTGGRPDGIEIDKLSLRLGDDLVLNDQDVARAKRKSGPPQGGQELFDQRIAGTNLVSERDGKNSQFVGPGRARHAILIGLRHWGVSAKSS